jgi:hypothetical protein
MDDTSPRAAARYLELLRAAPPARSLQIAAGLSVATKRLAIAGIRQRDPGADEAEVRRRLARLLYGEEAATQIDRLQARRANR